MRSHIVVIRGYEEPDTFLQAAQRQLNELNIQGNIKLINTKDGTPKRKTIKVTQTLVGFGVEISNLSDRLNQAFANPASVNRFGALCLGESRDLVDQIELLSENYQVQSLQWLIRDEYGYLSLPYWVDRVGSKKTRWLRYSLENREQQQPPESSWTIIQSI